MLSTIIVAAIFLGLVILQVILWAMFLRLGLRWATVPDITTRKVVLATGGALVIQLMLYIHLRLFAPTSGVQTIVTGVIELAATVLVPCLVIVQVFKVRFFRALQAWLPTLLSSVAMILFVFLVLRPFICEAFVSPTNAMAPTLLGTHWRGKCPECGQSSFCSPVDTWYGPPKPRRMICGSFHVKQVPDLPQQTFPPDRFL